MADSEDASGGAAASAASGNSVSNTGSATGNGDAPPTPDVKTVATPDSKVPQVAPELQAAVSSQSAAADSKQAKLQGNEPLEEKQELGVVPRLDELLLMQLAENYDTYPALDQIPDEYTATVVESDMFDPAKIKITVAAKYITTERFWKRLAQDRWPLCKIKEHGNSWRRLFSELHVQHLLEDFAAMSSTTHDHNLDKLMEEVKAIRPFVFSLTLNQLPSHVDLSHVLKGFPNLSSLTVTYGAQNVGMEYTTNEFGMNYEDVKSICTLCFQSHTISRLSLPENQITDRLMAGLVKGLQHCHALTSLDLSHNRIGDRGAEALASLLDNHNVLMELDLSDNAIQAQGARALADVLMTNHTLLRLSVRVNPISEDGGRVLFEALHGNSTLTHLNMSSTDLGPQCRHSLEQLITDNSTLKRLDLSGNVEIAADGGRVLLAALGQNRTLIELNLAQCGLEAGLEEQIASLVQKHWVYFKQARRKRLQQDDWDLAL